MLKCIPFNPEWANDTKHDFRAIYRRRKQDNWGVPQLDAEGREQWDTTAPLPLRQHNAWTRKGFVYVTLVVRPDDEAWRIIAPWIRHTLGDDPMSYVQNRRERSTWDVALYTKGAAASLAAEERELRDLVAQYGVEAVVAIKRQTQPTWEMPHALRTHRHTAHPEPDPDSDDDAEAPEAEAAPAPVRRPRGRPRKAVVA